MNIYSIDRHFFVDKETDIMYQEMVNYIWKIQKRPGKPKISEGYRSVVRYAHELMFPEQYEAKIDLSTANI